MIRDRHHPIAMHGDDVEALFRQQVTEGLLRERLSIGKTQQVVVRQESFSDSRERTVQAPAPARVEPAVRYANGEGSATPHQSADGMQHETRIIQLLERVPNHYRVVRVFGHEVLDFSACRRQSALGRESDRALIDVDPLKRPSLVPSGSKKSADIAPDLETATTRTGHRNEPPRLGHRRWTLRATQRA